MKLHKSQAGFASTLFLMGLVGYTPLVAAQTGPDGFTATTQSLAGSVTCANGSINPISVDPSTTVDSGSNDSTAGTTSLSLCGQTIYNAVSIDDKSGASEAPSLDDGTGETDAQTVSLLSGLVTFNTEQAPITCQSVDANGDTTCSGTATFSHLVLNGTAVADGTYLPGTSFNIVNAQILAPSCTGVALFTGSLVLADSQTSNTSIEAEWLHLTGDATCIGLPLGTTHYDLRDDEKIVWVPTYKLLFTKPPISFLTVVKSLIP